MRPGKSWIVTEFKKGILQVLKVMENDSVVMGKS